MAKPKGIKWEEIEDLGKVPDSVIAERLGCKEVSVRGGRKKLGIPKTPTRWDTAPLGQNWDGCIAEQMGCKKINVTLARMARKIPPYTELRNCSCCGESFWAKRNNHLCCSRRCANRQRVIQRALGVDTEERLDPGIFKLYQNVLRHSRTLSGDPRGTIEWDKVPDLGRVSDSQIAARLGCTTENVYKYRKARGIKSNRQRKSGK
jgi:hypothetical protein